MTMATITNYDNAAWNVLAAQVLQQLHYDDVLAVTAVLLASVAYLTNGIVWNRPDPYRYQLFEKPSQPEGASGTIKHSKCLSERLEQAGAGIAILWASQSGTGERFAVRLAKELIQLFGAKVLLLDISDIDPASCAKLQKSNLAIFIASTFGEGDPSDNMHDFWAWLQQLSGMGLTDMRFLAFGLGNSNYKHYNHVIDVLVEKIQGCGGHELISTGRADDATGTTEEDFLDWKQRVFELFESKLGYQRREVFYEPSIQISESSAIEQTADQLEPSATQMRKTLQPKIYNLPIVHSRELFQDSASRNCLHLELDIARHPEFKYKTGDYLSVWPVNPVSEVDCLLLALGLDSKRTRTIHITSLDGTAVKVPSPSTIEAMFHSSLEICAPLSRDHVRSIAAFAPDAPAQELLNGLCTDRVAYAKYLTSHYTNLGRLLHAACNTPGAWSQLPLSLMVEILPALQPRSYSISSSSVVQARQVAITAVVADTPLADSEGRIPGLTSNYLLHAATGQHPHGLTYRPRSSTQLPSGPSLYASVRKSAFKLPTTASAPIVMVGAGTGVAPFRAFVQERARLADMGRAVGTTKLFFGCRHPEQDSLYAEEFAGFAKKLGAAFALTPAFSRPTDGSRKRYVQDAIVEEADEMFDLLVERNAHFYICGSAAMARDVSDSVARLIMARKGWSEVQMKDFADRQKAQRRWLQDVWG